MTAPLRLDPAFAQAVAAARAFIAARQRGDWHSVACVVLTGTGQRFVGVNLDSTLPRASTRKIAVEIPAEAKIIHITMIW